MKGVSRVARWTLVELWDLQDELMSKVPPGTTIDEVIEMTICSKCKRVEECDCQEEE